MMKCDNCQLEKDSTKPVVWNGIYYPHLCHDCLQDIDPGISSAAAGFDRRRQYEDHAEDTVQPYNATGPNEQFYRLYPVEAAKVFTPEEIEQVKKKL
jgi:hypothetical protein